MVMLVSLSLSLTGCGTTESAELLGDVAYAEGRWSHAIAEWSRAGESPQLMAKRADASLAANRLSDAAEAWIAVSTDPARVGEAAAGLARTAHAAEKAGDEPALVKAIVGLRTVAPMWPLGRLALAVELSPDALPEEVLVVVPAKLAAGASGMAADDLLLSLGRMERARQRCHAAEPLLTALSARARPPVSTEAAGELAGCELTAGLAALAEGQLDVAFAAFERAAARDGVGVNGRRALIGLGDVHLLQGDAAAASLAWRAVASALVAEDSITALALERLRTALPTDALEYPDVQ